MAASMSAAGLGARTGEALYRFADEYKALRNRKPPVGRALTQEEQERLFAMAQTRPAWR
jgi:hypothetical protein